MSVGLLDFSNTDEGMQGLGLLGAAAPSMAPMNLAGRIAQAVQGYQGLRKDALQNKLLTLQEMRAQQQFEMQKDAYYGSPGGADSTPSVASGMPQQASPGMPQSTPDAPQASPQSMMAPQPNMSAQLDRLGRMALANIPGTKEQLDILKYRNEQQTLAPGILRNPVSGQITTLPITSTNGTSSQQIPDPTAPGGFRVIAPNGAVDVARAYSDATEDNKIVTVPNGVGGSKQMLTKDYRALLGGGTAQPMSPAQTSPAMQPGDSSAQFVSGKDGVPISAQDIMRRIAQIPDAKQRMASTQIMQQYLSQQNQAPQSQPSASPIQGGGTLGYTPPAAQIAADTADAVATVKLRTDPAIKSATDIAGGDVKNFFDHKIALNKAVEEQRALVQRNQEILPLLDQYQTGRMGSDGLLKLSSSIQNMMPDNPTARMIATKIAGGDVSAGQELNQLLSSAGLSNVIQTLQGQGRVNNAEFKALAAHAETSGSDPDTLRRLMQYQNKLYTQSFSEQQALSAAEKNGTVNPKTWEADYAKTLNDSALGAQTQPMSKPVQSVVSKANGLSVSVNGKTYTFPNQKALANFKLEAGIK